jgi:hypothetical protein
MKLLLMMANLPNCSPSRQAHTWHRHIPNPKTLKPKPYFSHTPTGFVTIAMHGSLEADSPGCP